ncbi:MAG TPA: MFS transporter [Candidatus Eisenbacteria bacterium]|nr:MFS transporter [Candidatus Eisenbacteria bacterium]
MVRGVGRVLSEYWAQVRGSGRNPRLYLVGVFLFGLGQSIFMLIFNLYLRSLGYSDSGIGQILSKVSIGAAVAALPAAFLFRRAPARTLLVLAGALTALGYALQATLRAPELLLLLSFVTGMVITVFRLSIAPVIMRETGSGARPFLFSAAFGVLFASAIVGSIVGGALPHLFHALYGEDQAALRATLYAGCVLTLLSAVPFFAMTEPAGSATQPPPTALTQIRDFLEIDWGLHLKLLLPAALVGLGAGLIIPFMNLYFRDRFGLSEGEIGALFAVMQGFMVVGNLFGPAVSRRIGLVAGVVATQLASVPFMVVLALSGSFPLVAAAFFLRSGLMNMNQPLASHFAMEVVSERDHAVTNSLLSLAWFLAWSVSADIGGALIERKGYTEPLLVAAGLYVAASVLYWVFFRDVEEASVPRAEVEIPEA